MIESGEEAGSVLVYKVDYHTVAEGMLFHSRFGLDTDM